MRSTKSIKQMEQLDFCGYEDLVEEILNELQYVKFEGCGSISVIAKYDDAVKVVEGLICNNVRLNAITLLEPELYSGYNKEFVITVDNYGVSAEPMWRDAYGNRPAGYLYDESTICYVFGNCHQKILDHIDYAVAFEVNILDCEECCDNCGECCDEHKQEKSEMQDVCANLKACNSCNEYCGEKMNIQSSCDCGMHGFTASSSDDNNYKSYSFYSDDMKLVKEMMSIIKKFGL